MSIQKTATIFGGTGFVGRHIVRRLAKQGYVIRIASRTPQKAYFLKPCGNVGQIVPTYCDYGDDSITTAVHGADVVINCIGILFEKGKSRFENAHMRLPEKIAKACTAENIKRFIHISSLAADRCGSQYAESKKAGEALVKNAFPNVTILQPSLIFGPEDDFFNQFAELSIFLPFLPLIGGGTTKFQPIYVDNVAEAVEACLFVPETKGQTFALGGNEILTFKELMERMFSYTKRPRPLIPLPFWVARIKAFFLSLLPKPLLTQDQITALQNDNILGDAPSGLKALNITATSLDAVLPTYLGRVQPGGRFGRKGEAL